MRKLETYTRKYGEEFGRKFYHALQSQAAHAGVSARLRRKIEALTGQGRAPARKEPELPLFDPTSPPWTEVADAVAESNLAPSIA